MQHANLQSLAVVVLQMQNLCKLTNCKSQKPDVCMCWKASEEKGQNFLTGLSKAVLLNQCVGFELAFLSHDRNG